MSTNVISTPKKKSRPPKAEASSWMAECLAWGMFAAGLFVFLTSAIPLIRSLDPSAEITKKLASRVTAFTVLSAFGVFGFWAWRFPDSLKRVSLTRFLKDVAEMPDGAKASVLFVLYTAGMSWVGFTRHWALETRAFDLGIFAQAVWTTLQGDFLYSSIKGGICLLGDHVSPLVAALAPVYALWSDPKCLIFLQAAAAGACLFPLAALARQKTGHSFLTGVFILAYFLYLPTRNALREDFHPEVLVECFLILSFMLMNRRRWAGALFLLLIAVSAKENMLGIALMFGVYAFFWMKARVIGTLLAAAALGLFFFEVKWVIPHFSGQTYLYTGNYWNLLSGGALELVRTLARPEVLEYAFKIFLPFLFLPVFHFPTLILTFPVLFQNLLSSNEAMLSFNYHYTTGLTPFVFISSIYAVSAITERWPWLYHRRHFLALALLATVLLRSGPSEYFYYTDIRSHRSAHKDMIREKMKAIPQKASVLTHNNLIPQAINRRGIYQFEYLPEPTKGQMAKNLDADYVLLEKSFWEPKAASYEEALEELRGAGYGETFTENGFHIFQKV